MAIGCLNQLPRKKGGGGHSTPFSVPPRAPLQHTPPSEREKEEKREKREKNIIRHLCDSIFSCERPDVPLFSWRRREKLGKNRDGLLQHARPSNLPVSLAAVPRQIIDETNAKALAVARRSSAPFPMNRRKVRCHPQKRGHKKGDSENARLKQGVALGRTRVKAAIKQKKGKALGSRSRVRRSAKEARARARAD